MCKEAVVAKFEVLSQHFHGQTKLYDEKFIPGEIDSGQRLEPGTSRLRKSCG
jgi:hypothetical protein